MSETTHAALVARRVQIDNLVAGPIVVATRDPVAEAKIHGYVMLGLYNGALLASFTKTEVDDRLVARAIQKFADPVFWADFANDVWGPVGVGA